MLLGFVDDRLAVCCEIVEVFAEDDSSLLKKESIGMLENDAGIGMGTEEEDLLISYFLLFEVLLIPVEGVCMSLCNGPKIKEMYYKCFSFVAHTRGYRVLSIHR